MPSEFQRTVRRRLEAVADPALAEGYERYFKHTAHFLGVRTPTVRAIAREVMATLRDAPIDRVMAEAFALLRSRWMEEKHVSGLLLAKHAARLPGDFLDRLAPGFEDGVRDWATSDLYSGRVFRPLLAQTPQRRAVVGWSRSTNLWRQRAAAVAFTAEARHGRYTPDILAVCRRVVKNTERFAQLGVGWVLRELYLAESDVVVAFLREHYQTISREGLRYAIEKMPAALQGALLAEHLASRAKPPRVPRRGPTARR